MRGYNLCFQLQGYSILQVVHCMLHLSVLFASTSSCSICHNQAQIYRETYIGGPILGFAIFRYFQFVMLNNHVSGHDLDQQVHAYAYNLTIDFPNKKECPPSGP